MRNASFLIGFIFCLYAALPPLAAQETEEVIFRTISPQGGFTDRGVEQIEQDHLGFIWIATYAGLFKYDAYSFTKYVHSNEDSLSLSNDRIMDLLIDSGNRLWIATNEGLNLYNRGLDAFELVHPDHLNPNSNIPDLEKDEDGNIYIAAGSAIIKYNPETRTSIRIPLPHNDVRKIHVLRNKQIRVAFVGNGVYEGSLYGEFKQIIPPEKSTLRTAFFSDSLIMLGYDAQGIKIHNPEGNLISSYTKEDGKISHNKVNSILEDSKGKIWVGTYLGLDIIDKSGQIKHFAHNLLDPYSLPYSSVYAIYEDPRNDFWIGTWSGGLAYYNRFDNKFEHVHQIPGVNSLSNDYISCFTMDRGGDLWIGTERGGINRQNADSKRFQQFQPESERSELLNIKSLLCTSEDHIYIGTYREGFFKLDRNRKSTRIILDHIEPGNEKVYALAESDTGIWVGDFSGGLFLISKKNPRSQLHYDESDDSLGLSSVHIHSLFLDHGDLWIGTSMGLNLKRAGDSHFTRFFHDNDDPTSLSGNIITMITSDQEGNIWIGTRRGGLNKYIKAENSFIHYNINDGLSGNDANGILCDASGYLWISTENGISRFNPADGSVNNYNESDGLQGKQFIPAAALKSREGILYFGGTNGYTIIDPARIKVNPIAPTPVISSLIINNQKILASTTGSPLRESISEASHLKLKYNQSSISLQFTSNNYLNPSKSRYAYRMVGLNDVWQYRYDNHVSYSSMEPGKYTFELRATNNDGVWSKDPAQLYISIAPPWWRHYLAYIAYIMIGSIGMILIRNMILYRERMKSAMELESIKRENKEKIHQLKLQFFTNISHEFKTPLTLILSPIQRLVRERQLDPDIKEDLILVEKNAIRLKKLVNQFIEFRKIDQAKLKLFVSSIDIISLSEEIYSCFTEIADKLRIDYSFNQQIEPVKVWIDNEKMENAIFNVLSNAFKYTPEGGQVQFSIRQGPINIPESWHSFQLGDPGGKNFIFIEISDTGPGITEKDLKKIFERFYRSDKVLQQTGSGIGLSMAKEYTLLHQGTLQLASKPGAGSMFVFGIPLGKDHFSDNSDIEFIDQRSGSIRERKIEILLDEDPVPVEKQNKAEKEKALLLLIEDNPELNRYLSKTLSEKYRIAHTLNGEEGLSLASRLLPELILSDIMLPGVDGLELCSRIKSDPLTSHIPVILVTALSEDKQKIEGIETGADAYLTKPLDMQLLFSTINNLIEARKKLRLAFGGVQAALTRDEGLSAFDASLVRRAQQYINANIVNPDISTTDLAAELKMSRTNLHRKLKSLMDQSSTEFIRNIRINKAMKLLEQDGISISEVCYAVGFTSTSYFSKCFREIYGINPSEYKRNLGQSGNQNRVY